MQTNNKLREALERIASFPMPPPIELAQQTAVEMRDVAIAALAEPVRNCDVGTAEEQTRRMDAEYCHIQKSCYESPSGRECPLHKAEVDCRLIWAQMPYKEGGENYGRCACGCKTHPYMSPERAIDAWNAKFDKAKNKGGAK